MKKIFLLALGFMSLCMVSCSDDDLTPMVDCSNEYEARLKERATRSEADAQVWEWYQKYGSSFVYDFTEKEFRWQWAGTLSDNYVPFDMTQAEDMEKYQKLIFNIKEGFMANFTEERLRNNLPFRIFLVRQLNPIMNSFFSTGKDVVAAANMQDAIIVAYEDVENVPFTPQQIGSAMSGKFAMFFYNKLTVPPTDFIESRTKCNFDLVTTPANDAIAAEFSTTPRLSTNRDDLVYKDHDAYCCGYLSAGLPTRVQVPSEEQDFADYFAFITTNDSQTIRKYINNYKRIKSRAYIYLQYWKEHMGEDLLATHNKRYADDMLYERDFK